MADHTKIEWTDATANVVNGCSLASPGCTNCYAMKLAGTRLRTHPSRKGLTVQTKAGPVWNGIVRFSERALQDVLGWKKPRRIFWNAHGDLFHKSVPDEWIDRCFSAMAATPHHIHQVLTKRAYRMRQYLTAPGVAERISYEGRAGWPLPNVWLGVSVEDQERADERIPDLIATPAAIRWLSCEPLLGSIDLRSIKAPRYPDEPEDSLAIDWRFDALEVGDYYWFDCGDGYNDGGDGPYRDHRIDWVVVGGESGPGARPMHRAWARSLRDQCAEAGVPFFFKQFGAWMPSEMCKLDCSARDILIYDETGKVWREAQGDGGWIGDQAMCRVGKKVAGRLLDGVEHNGMPEVRND